MPGFNLYLHSALPLAYLQLAHVLGRVVQEAKVDEEVGPASRGRHAVAALDPDDPDALVKPPVLVTRIRM